MATSGYSYVFESNGHYYEPVLHFLYEHQIVYYLVNPVLSLEADIKMSLRKVYTYDIYAFRLVELALSDMMTFNLS